MHEPVLVAEVIEALRIKQAGCYLDCTFGRGGHSSAVLKNIGGDGRLIAIDRDPEAIAAGQGLQNDNKNLQLVQARFSGIAELINKLGYADKIDGVIMDLGVSSPQLDDANRGFSFRLDGPLDMRMDPDSGVDAADWLAGASERELADSLYTFGEERYARRIARRIVAARKDGRIERTAQLAEIVRRAVPGYGRRIHPATRTFQALRIQVNDELEELKAGLAQVTPMIAPEGRIAVIAFHSLEDRIVKRWFRDLGRDHDEPGRPDDRRRYRVVTRKPIRPGSAESTANPRARSARLRVLERVG